jgi:hypothetical protein
MSATTTVTLPTKRDARAQVLGAEEHGEGAYLRDTVHRGWAHYCVIRCVVTGCAGTKHCNCAGCIHSQVMCSCKFQHILDAMRVDLQHARVSGQRA